MSLSVLCSICLMGIIVQYQKGRSSHKPTERYPCHATRTPLTPSACASNASLMLIISTWLIPFPKVYTPSSYCPSNASKPDLSPLPSCHRGSIDFSLACRCLSVLPALLHSLPHPLRVLLPIVFVQITRLHVRGRRSVRIVQQTAHKSHQYSAPKKS